MADPIIVDSRGRRRITLNGTVSRFDLLAHNGTNWVQADASDATLPAQLIAIQAGVSGDVIEAVSFAVITDADDPHTQDGLVYLSETAGASTQTRPSTAASLRQKVGVAQGVDTVEYDLGFSEVRVAFQPGAAASGEATLDTGNFIAAQHLDAQNEIVTYNGTLPENFLSVEKAVVQVAAEATAGTPTADVIVASVVEGAQHDAVTADSSAVDLATEGSAADEMHDVDISGGFDATNIARPGAQISVHITKDDAGTDNISLYECYVICKVANR